MTQEREPTLQEDRPRLKVILIVEDDAVNAQGLATLIWQETPYRVFVADSRGALHFVRHIKPHLFILAYRLLGMSGIELFDHLHANRELQDIPAIILGASLEERLEEIVARKLIALPKPFDIADFLSTLEAVLA